MLQSKLFPNLQEINLLNAKLLYTNKIFRNKSLTESQKVKVLAAFDKAKNKQEAQLIYETLLGSTATTAKSPIKESLGSASKALGSVAKPIIENDAFARMRELAGLKKILTKKQKQKQKNRATFNHYSNLLILGSHFKVMLLN